MKTRVTVYDFLDDDLLKDSFSYQGKVALFDYLEQLEDDLGYELEYDPIAIRCDFTEYSSLKEIKSTYDDIKTIDDLYYYTSVIEFEGGIIIQDF
jgi:hypothetical protein